MAPATTQPTEDDEPWRQPIDQASSDIKTLQERIAALGETATKAEVAELKGELVKLADQLKAIADAPKTETQEMKGELAKLADQIKALQPPPNDPAPKPRKSGDADDPEKPAKPNTQPEPEVKVKPSRADKIGWL